MFFFNIEINCAFVASILCIMCVHIDSLVLCSFQGDRTVLLNGLACEFKEHTLINADD